MMWSKDAGRNTTPDGAEIADIELQTAGVSKRIFVIGLTLPF